MFWGRGGVDIVWSWELRIEREIGGWRFIFVKLV